MAKRHSVIDFQHSNSRRALTEGEENYHKIIEFAREGVAIHVDGIIVYANQKLLDILGLESPSEILGRTASELVQEARREISKELEITMLTESEELFSVEDVYERKDGRLIPVEVSAISILYQGKPAVQIIARDISERKKVEAEVWEYQNMLKRLSSDLILSEEAQRRNLAIVLHDQLGQSLAMAKIKMAGILNATSDEDLKQKLKAVEKDISDAVKQTRSITYELSPPVLHELGLIEALEWRLEKFTEETGIETAYDHNLENINLRDEQVVILFRSVDEVLKNILKHAQASRVLISIQVSKYSFTIKIHDDGKGFDTALLSPEQRKSGSFGLFSIKERIEYLGGVLDIQSEEGSGTVVTLIVPVSLEGI
ncbi:MAG: PAS domain-containing sensor histidine kinase [Candidatus Marinimicrobia bacterium]|nr:PAS domain-containing sensor histidine kinase [Candidatus Neomarinimicrobiota bacterium]